MVKYITYLFIIIVFTTCKRKTTITVKVYNDELHEFTPNATVLLVENHYKKRIYDPFGLGPIVTCKIIATKKTDINGSLVFENEKLKTNANTKYFLYVKNAWDIETVYTCITGKEINNETTMFLNDKRYDYGSFQFQINNLFSNVISNDSLVVYTYKVLFSSIQSSSSNHSTSDKPLLIKAFDNSSIPAITTTEQYNARGKYILKIRKRKMGVVTIITDTIKVYPNRLTTVMIDW